MEKQYSVRKRVCRFCADKKTDVSYKETSMLKLFLSERGKIVPRRISGTCTPHQKQLTRAIKRSRNIALLAFVEER